MRIACLVLAAGRSSRMAPRNKLLESVGGETMVRRVAATAMASGAEPVIVVTGHEAASVAGALRGLDVTIVANPDYADGLSTSLRAGLRALPQGIDGALILLGDMPRVEASVLSALMAAFTGANAICVPVRHGRRGNPVLWGRSYFAEMMQLHGDTGAKPLVARHEARLIEVEVATDSIFEDVDAPEDLERLKRSGAAS
ncbi:MAG TPA: nucleotidyltransferase family protein [Methyloceanibacter sp.]|nr:nucleotidyltransferase family protein [Methyloceanibacter sp.]